LWEESIFHPPSSNSTQLKEMQAISMSNQISDVALSAPKPRSQSSDWSDKRFTIAFWMIKYETDLFHTRPASTYKRYTRALDKLFAFFPEKRFFYQFLRHDMEDFKKARLERGVSPKTVNIELSIIRSLWDYLLKAKADGVLMNPARGVRVPMKSKKKS
jgi:hypothetical protein